MRVMIWFWAICIQLSSIGLAMALSYQPLTPREVAEASREVVIAEVIAVDDEPRADGGLVQRVTLRVHERWKGPPRPTVTLRQLRSLSAPDRSGAIRSIAGNIFLELGGTYLLFLREPVDLPRVPITVAGEAGLFRAERDAQGWRFAALDGRIVRGVSAERLRYGPPPHAGGAPAPILPVGGSRVAARRVRIAPGTELPLAVSWRMLVAEALR